MLLSLHHHHHHQNNYHHHHCDHCHHHDCTIIISIISSSSIIIIISIIITVLTKEHSFHMNIVQLKYKYPLHHPRLPQMSDRLASKVCTRYLERPCTHQTKESRPQCEHIWAKILLVMDTSATCFIIFRHNPERYKHKLFMSDRVYTWTP